MSKVVIGEVLSFKKPAPWQHFLTSVQAHRQSNFYSMLKMGEVPGITDELGYQCSRLVLCRD